MKTAVARNKNTPPSPLFHFFFKIKDGGKGFCGCEVKHEKLTKTELSESYYIYLVFKKTSLSSERKFKKKAKTLKKYEILNFQVINNVRKYGG